MSRRVRSRNHIVVGGLVITFFVGTFTGSFVKRFRTPPLNLGVVSEDERIRSVASESRESAELLATDERCWDVRRIPLSVLKTEYLKRSSEGKFETLVRERFALSSSEQISLIQQRLQPLFLDRPFWKGNLRFDAKGLEVEFSFYLGFRSGELQEGIAHRLFIVDEISSTPGFALWNPVEVQGEPYVVSTTSGQLSPGLQARYAAIAVTLPLPGSRDAHVELLDVDTEKWTRVGDFEWFPVSEDEYFRGSRDRPNP